MAEPSTSLHPDPFVPQDSDFPDHAKANYLSGQLRLRLQYAKLKVEHGWQRQTLNEVENLYFRHTQMHRPLPAVGHRNIRALWENVASTSSASSPFEEYTTDHTSFARAPGSEHAESSLPDAPTTLPPGSISPPTAGDATMTDAFTPVPDAHRAASTPRGGRRGTARKRLPSSRPAADLSNGAARGEMHQLGDPARARSSVSFAQPASSISFSSAGAGLTYDAFWSSHPARPPRATYGGAPALSLSPAQPPAHSVRIGADAVENVNGAGAAAQTRLR